MADYSAYLPQTPPSAAYIGLSPEEEYQLKQYSTPDNVGRIHPMGGLALAGHERYQEGMHQYLDAVLQGNIWRQHQLQQVMQNNLREASINQMGRLGPELVRSGDTRLMAGSDFAGMALPGLTDAQGGPSDAAVEADTNARAIREATRQKELATSANQMQQAGYTPEVQSLAQEYNLPLSKSSPTAVQVAAQHARGMAAGGSGGAPVKTRAIVRWDPVRHANITDYIYDTRANAVSGAHPAAPAVSSASPSTSANVPAGYIPVGEEELTDGQMAHAAEAGQKADQAGYTPMGYFTAPDGKTVLMVQKPGEEPIELPLDDAGGTSGDEGP